MFRRRQATTHRVQMREELGQSLNHFKQAASHAASGTANLIGPRYDSATRSVKKSVGPGVRRANRATAATVLPLAVAVGRNARRGKAKVMREQQSTRRWPMLLGGLLAAGAAVGAAGAVIARRRASRDQWEEYGSTRSTGSSRTDSVAETAKSTLDTGRDKVQSLAESAKERAAEMTSSSRSSSAPSAPSSAASSAASAAPSAPMSAPSAPASSPSSASSPASSATEFGSREDLYGKAGSGSNSNRP